MKKLILAAIIVAVFSMPCAATTRQDVQSVLDDVYAKYPTWASSYEVNVWDCSEMGQYLYDEFRARGFAAKRCNSPRLWHCWVEVYPAPYAAEWWVVEATTLEIVDDAAWYYSESVQRNGGMKRQEVDWWNSPIFRSAGPGGVGPSGLPGV